MPEDQSFVVRCGEALPQQRDPAFESDERRFLFIRDDLCEQLVVGGVARSGLCVETGWQVAEVIEGERTPKYGPSTSRSRGELSLKKAFASFDACVDFQLELLGELFQEIRTMAGDAGVSMGLSGGYDSRLMLLLAVEAGIPVSPFTFSSDSHAKELAIARTLADSLGLGVRQVPVRKWTDLTEDELDQNIDDAITYYAGHTNETMGTFSDVHTARVQRLCVGEAAINLNGLGGELYRNRERLPNYRFWFANWFWQYVAGPRMLGAFKTKDERARFENRMAMKYGRILGVGELDWMDRHRVRTWYRKVWLPCFAGVRLAAENRVAPSIMPFAQPAISAAALAATPYIGPHGEFEAEMITRLDARIAALPSSYGPGFSKTPLHRKLRDFAMSMVPVSSRLVKNRVKHRLRPRRPAAMPERFRERLTPPIDHLKSLDLPVDIDFLLADPLSRDRTLYVAEYLYRHRDRLVSTDADRTGI